MKRRSKPSEVQIEGLEYENSPLLERDEAEIRSESSSRATSLLEKAKETANKYIMDEEYVSFVLSKVAQLLDRIDCPLTSSHIDNLDCLLTMLIAHFKKDRKLQNKSLITIFGALIYVVTPLDFVPDTIPFVGYVDDAAVLGLVVNQLKQELHDFKDWQERVNYRSFRAQYKSEGSGRSNSSICPCKCTIS
jgi:uncharacterized membrane protein YkvA (DUF1232 family)